MPNPNFSFLKNSWPLSKGTQSASNFEALTAVEADALPVELSLGTPHAVFALVRDSLNILGAFALGKEARLSRNHSAQLCELMNVG